MHAPMSSTSRVSLASDGTVEGYASLFGEVDQARDMVMPGAFTRTLAQRGLRKIPMLFQHDPAEPVGIWLDLHEDFRGLRARGRLIPDVARGRELLALVREGAIDGLSIGYRTVRGQIDPKTRIRKLYQVDLWEISIVTFPLLAGARVRAVKQAFPEPKLSLLRTRAENEWRGLSGGADAPAPLTRRGSPALTRLDTRAGRKRALQGVASPGTDVASVFPALDQTYSPNQPRVPAGSGRESGRWTDGEGGNGSLARPMSNIGINDPRVVSDADSDTVRPSQQYAQNRPRSGGRVLINGQQFELTPAQAARLSVAQARAEGAIARIREIESSWKPPQSAYQSPEGLIRAYEAEAVAAQVRASELFRMGIGPGPFAGESIPARGPERNFTTTERDEINRIGFETGCHTCGIRVPGTKRENFVPDHQVPNGLNYGGRSQRLYPQCISCSWSQGGHVNNLKSK